VYKLPSALHAGEIFQNFCICCWNSSAGVWCMHSLQQKCPYLCFRSERTLLHMSSYTFHAKQVCIRLIIYCCLLWYAFPQLNVCITITELFCANYRFIFRILLHDFKGFKEFTVLQEDARILLHQTTVQLDAYAAQVLLFAMWPSLICCFIIN